ncbi:MAG: prephenate dehydrogenase [Aigarchaeota archaeon]|nr:prephenate dehydrogenase [Candidatus Pelearchaeum maunauluense]
MRIAIIGAGAMGCWFAQDLKKQGHRIVLFDKERKNATRAARRIGCASTQSIENALKDVDAVIIAVPISETPNTIKQVLKTISSSTIVVELSSVKAPLARIMPQLKKTGNTVLLLHPLFGPGAGKRMEKTIVLTPLRDAVREKRVLRSLFPWARVIVMNIREHDRAMAYLMALTRLSLLALLKCWQPYRNIPQTTSQKLLLLAASTLLNESPTLLTQIIKENPYTKQAYQQYTRTIQKLLKKTPYIKQQQEIIRENYRGMNRLYRAAYTLLTNM